MLKIFILYFFVSQSVSAGEGQNWRLAGQNIANFQHQKRTIKNFYASDSLLKEVDFSDNQIALLSLFQSTIRNSRFDRVQMQKAFCNHTQFKNVSFERATWEASEFLKCHFVDSNLTEIDFTGAKITNSRFRNSVLKSSKFNGLKARGIQFFSADLRSAQFRHSLCLECEFISSDLRGADMSTFVCINCNFKDSIVDRSTKLTNEMWASQRNKFVYK